MRRAQRCFLATALVALALGLLAGCPGLSRPEAPHGAPGSPDLPGAAAGAPDEGAPRPSEPLDAPHTPANAVYCTSCHSPADFADKGGSARCQECHRSRGVRAADVHARADGTVLAECADCHDPHYQAQARVFGAPADPSCLVRASIDGRAVRFVARTGPGSFADGAAPYDGICETCHTTTEFHRRDAAGGHAHKVGERCTMCHTHENGFRAVADVASTCASCHARENDPPHVPANGVECTSCHAPPTFAATGTAGCKACHAPGGAAPLAEVHVKKDGSILAECTECHDPHLQQQHRAFGTPVTVSAYVRTTVRGRAVELLAREGAGSLADGAAPFDGLCEACHTTAKYHRRDETGNHAHKAGQACTSCHAHAAGFQPAGGECGDCHGVPPSAGRHRLHFAGTIAEAAYGDLRTAQDHPAPSTTTAYLFGCGNCHPLDERRHMDDVVDVELWNPAAPTSTVKALNAPDARYTPGAEVLRDEAGLPYTSGTCSGVYCHSKQEYVAPHVPEPGADFAWTHPLGQYLLTNPGYDMPNNLSVTTVYATPSWTAAAPEVRCGQCHGYPPRSYYPENARGLGDSHGHIDDWGYENLHNFNMGQRWPIQCHVCHVDTTREELPAATPGAPGYSYDAMDVLHYGRDMAILGYGSHVNGRRDVRFDAAFVLPYDSSATFTGNGLPFPPTLTAARWDAATRTCSSVPCHLKQTAVPDGPRGSAVWGQPYGWWGTPECDQCHQYGY